LSVDEYVEQVTARVAHALTRTGLHGGELRESLHLDPFFKNEVERRSGVRPLSRTLRTPDFPGLGPVDVVLERSGALLELKWSYQRPGKVFESVWDATKLALLGESRGYDALYLVTGAALDEWSDSESADLFCSGTFDVLAAWSRPLIPPRSPNRGRTVGEDLVIGARGNKPRRAHARLAIRRVGAFRVAGDYELRVVRIVPEGPLVEWPPIEVAMVAPIPESFTGQLPPRVTQAWIERTAPHLDPSDAERFLQALRIRGWNQEELDARVRPHLPRSE
jgi:hypothetical protein